MLLLCWRLRGKAAEPSATDSHIEAQSLYQPRKHELASLQADHSQHVGRAQQLLDVQESFAKVVEVLKKTRRL